MPFIETPIAGLVVFEPKVFKDDRGYFFESYNERAFLEAGVEARFVQDNQSFSTKGTIRGLHYQTGDMAQAKLVRVIQGEVLDVAVDIREGSPTYGQAYAIHLSDTNARQLFIPRGFAHGFATLSETAVFSYKCDNYYSKEHEGGILWNDETLNIDWIIPEGLAILSDKDKVLPNFGSHRKI